MRDRRRRRRRAAGHRPSGRSRAAARISCASGSSRRGLERALLERHHRPVREVQVDVLPLPRRRRQRTAPATAATATSRGDRLTPLPFVESSSEPWQLPRPSSTRHAPSASVPGSRRRRDAGRSSGRRRRARPSAPGTVTAATSRSSSRTRKTQPSGNAAWSWTSCSRASAPPMRILGRGEKLAGRPRRRCRPARARPPCSRRRPRPSSSTRTASSICVEISVRSARASAASTAGNASTPGVRDRRAVPCTLSRSARAARAR